MLRVRPAWQQRLTFRRWTRRDSRDFMFRSGKGFGYPNERRRKLWPNLMPLLLLLWPVRGSVSGSPKSSRRFRPASSRRRRRSARCRGPRSINGGQSLRPRVSSRNDSWRFSAPNGIFHLSSANSRDPERLRLAWLVPLDDEGDRDAVRSNVVPRVVNATKKPTHNHVRSAQPYLDGLLRTRAGKNPKSRSACGTRHAIHGMLDTIACLHPSARFVCYGQIHSSNWVLGQC